MKSLTLKQKKFVEETIKTLNPTEAVRRVYNLGSKGGSKDEKRLEQTARAIASENLTKPNIKKAFQELLEEIDDKEILDMLREIVRDKKDKRARIEAGKELLKLKNRYPKQKLSVELFEEELKKIAEE